MIYEFECEKCTKVYDEYRRCEDRDLPSECPDCGSTGKRHYIAAGSKANIVMKQEEFTTDFGTGEGERTYKRQTYLDKCKELNRDPVGVLWK